VPKQPQPMKPATLARILYGVALLLFFAASFLPSLRVWGLSVWAHFPIYVPILLLLTGAGLSLLEFYWTRKATDKSAKTETGGARSYFVISAALIGAWGILCYLLKGQTHFLGDGYTLLSALAKDLPLVKTREVGEALIHVWVRDLFGGPGESSAALSYQAISIGAGICFGLIAAIGAARLFTAGRDRLIFLVGLYSGGYSLMFFGYAENYSLFCVSILLFTLVGMLISLQKCSRWWILAPFALATFMHVLGLTLLPAALYVLLVGTPAWNWFLRQRKGARQLWFVSVIAVGIALFIYLFVTDYFFRFAFVPLVATRYSVTGYTLFSPAHLIDLLNLLLLLVPGLLLLPVLPRMQPLKKLFETTTARFLLLLVVSTIFATSVLDPKLGLIRDWDLFSYSGVPIVSLFLWLILTRASRARTQLTLAALTVALGMLSLIPRILCQAIPQVGIDTFKDYLWLDPERARAGMYNLSTYYLNHADTAAATANEQLRRQMFPFEPILRQASDASNNNQEALAKSLVQQALELNPANGDTWLSLARCYERAGKYDSALAAAEIADGLDPYINLIQHEKALAYFHLGKTDEAAKIWRDLSGRDTSEYSIPFCLARLYQAQGNSPDYNKYLEIAAVRSSAPAEISLEVAKNHIQRGDIDGALAACQRAIARGADSTKLAAVTKLSPELATRLQAGH
jgi:tetratricopeptide (TPR) repeat protein